MKNKKEPICPYMELKDGRIWNLEWDHTYQGWVYRTKKNVYKLFGDGFNGVQSKYLWSPHVWVGMLSEEGKCWFTVEAHLRIKSVHIFGSEVIFK